MAPRVDLVARYYLFRMTNAAGFILPIAIYSLVDRDFGMGFILFSYAIFSFATLAVEVPTGYIGDWLGRRASLALGSTLRAVVYLVYPLLETHAAILSIHVVWAVARSFRSGTQDAWLYELLSTYRDPDDFTRIESRGSSVLLLTSAAGAIAGGFLYTMDMTYPFLVNAGFALTGLPLLYTFPAVRNQGAGAEAKQDDNTGSTLTVREALRILRVQVERPSVRWLVAYAAIFNSVFLITRIYEQPALDSLGIPVAGFGFLYAAFKFVSAGAASTAEWVRTRLGTRNVFLLLVPVYGLAYLSITIVPMLLVPVLFLNRSVRIVTRPIRNQYLNDRLDDIGRATVLSGAAMVLSFGGGIARLASGWLAEAVGPVTFLGWTGVVLSIAGGVVWILVSPVRSGSGRGVSQPAASD